MRIGALSWTLLFLLCASYLALTAWTLPGEVPIRYGLEGDAIGRFSRQGFIVWMLSFLVGLNVLFIVIKRQLRKKSFVVRMHVPWKKYWYASVRRRAEAMQRLQDVLVMAGLMVNSVWLISYHLIMQEFGQSLGLPISTSFGVYMNLVATLVLFYGAITYFRPP